MYLDKQNIYYRLSKKYFRKSPQLIKNDIWVDYIEKLVKEFIEENFLDKDLALSSKQEEKWTIFLESKIKTKKEKQ